MRSHGHQFSSQSEYRMFHGGVDGEFHNGSPHTHVYHGPSVMRNYGVAATTRPTLHYQADLTLFVKVKHGRVTKLTVSPKEADAGYFGPILSLDHIDVGGEDLDVSDYPGRVPERDAVWTMVGEYLEKNQVFGSDDRHFFHWEG